MYLLLDMCFSTLRYITVQETTWQQQNSCLQTRLLLFVPHLQAFLAKFARLALHMCTYVHKFWTLYTTFEHFTNTLQHITKSLHKLYNTLLNNTNLNNYIHNFSSQCNNHWHNFTTNVTTLDTIAHNYSKCHKVCKPVQF